MEELKEDIERRTAGRKPLYGTLRECTVDEGHGAYQNWKNDYPRPIEVVVAQTKAKERRKMLEAKLTKDEARWSEEDIYKKQIYEAMDEPIRNWALHVRGTFGTPRQWPFGLWLVGWCTCEQPPTLR